MASKSSQKVILIIQFSSNLDGSAVSALLLANGFKEAGWKTNIAFAFNGPIIPLFQKAGHDTSLVPHKNWLRREKWFQFLKDVYLEKRKVKSFIHQIDHLKPDLIYVNTIASLASVLAASKRTIPIIWHIRELFSDAGGEMHAPSSIRNFLPAFIYKYSSKQVITSNAVIQNVFRNRKKQSLSIIANAVEDTFLLDSTTIYEARKKLSLPETKTIIGLPSAPRPVKGYPYFLKSVAPLVHGRDDVIIAVAGSCKASYVKVLKTLIKQLGILDSVYFLGALDDMPLFYKSCTLICVPSESESFGRTIIEAFACKTPVIATNVGGIKEIIRHGENGFLVQYGDQANLLDCINFILDHPEKCSQIVRQAFVDVKIKFTSDIYKKKILRIATSINH